MTNNSDKITCRCYNCRNRLGVCQNSCTDIRNCGRHHCACGVHIPLTQGECKVCRP